MKVSTFSPSIQAQSRPTATPSPSQNVDTIDLGNRNEGPNLKEALMMVAIGTGAGFIQSQMGGWGAPLATIGGAAAMGGAEHYRASRQEDKSTLGLATAAGGTVGAIVGTVGFVGAHVGHSLGLNPIISAGVSSAAAVGLMKLAG